jgi:hypothetical protein
MENMFGTTLIKLTIFHTVIKHPVYFVSTMKAAAHIMCSSCQKYENLCLKEVKE